MYKLFLSFRFLVHHWLMTLIGSFFVGASLTILVVVMAVMDGFQERLKETYAGSSADLTVTPRYPVDVPALERVLRDSLGDLAVASGPYYQTLTLVRKEGRVDPALEQEFYVGVVFGVDGQKEQRVNSFGSYISNGTDDTPKKQEFLQAPFQVPDPLDRAIGRVGVIVGSALLEEMGLRQGDHIRIMAVQPRKTEPGANGNGAGDPNDRYELKNGLFQIVGKYSSGNHEIDKRCVFMEHSDFGRFFNDATAKPAVRLKLASPDDFIASRVRLQSDIDKIARLSVREGQRRHPDDVAMRVQTWQDLNRTLVSAIESEKSMILVIAFLIVVAGTSSIFAAQWLLVTDKIREIGLLRALGARVGGVTMIFVANGFLMGVLGAVGGVAMGLFVVENIDAVAALIGTLMGRDVFNQEIYLFKSIPTKLNYDEILRYGIAALVCTLIAAAVPALRAGFMDPAKALHRD